jgi:hypothetical protein
MKEKDSSEFAGRIETGLSQVYTTLAVGEPTKKIRKLFARSAKKISKEIKQHLKAEVKREAKKKKAELKARRKKLQKEPKAKVAKKGKA